MRAGPRPSFSVRNSGSTGSSIEIVAAIATTTAAQMATGRECSTTRIGTCSVSARSDGISSQTNPTATAAAIAATRRNGARMPPAS
jgi:hypothetical protein